jgi:uncharacterized protein YjbI with pentapeptide repeats
MSEIESGQQYRDRRFARITAHGQRYETVEFSGCRFDRCTFAQSTFYRCVFTECRFSICDMSGVQVPNSRWIDVAFKGSKLIGIDWTQVGESAVSKLLISLDCDECVLNYSSFFGMNLAGRSFTRCVAHEVDLREADLTGAILGGTDFAGALFHNTTLRRADLIDAINYMIDPTTNAIAKARFTLPEVLSLLRGFDIVIE